MSKLSSIDFMERHLEDAVEEEYEELCKQVIKDLEELEERREKERSQE